LADELKQKISGLPSADEYAQLKSKLQVLKALEHELSAETGSEGAEMTVESVLRDKLRKLETENVHLRVHLLSSDFLAH